MAHERSVKNGCFAVRFRYFVDDVTQNPYAQIVGLFGVADGAHIYNITMRDYDILSAGLKADSRAISPILVYGNGNTRSYDNFLYPKEATK